MKCQKQSARINNLIRDKNQFQSKYESRVEKIRTSNERRTRRAEYNVRVIRMRTKPGERKKI